MPVRFQLNGVLIEENDVSPSMTVLDYLRETKGLKGTKEGCAEGDCGACSITIQSALGRVKTVNACLMLVPQLDGMSVVTVEGLSAPDTDMHPVQQALVDNHAAQCGFCTPGFRHGPVRLYADRRVQLPQNLCMKPLPEICVAVPGIGRLSMLVFHWAPKQKK